MLSIRKINTLFLFQILFTIYTYSQESVDDSLFNRAKAFAKEAKYVESLQIMDKLTTEKPQNFEYQLFIGKLLSWQGNYERSVEILTTLLNKYPDNQENLEALLNVLFWSKKYEQLENVCDLALTKQKSIFILLKKAQALEAQNKDELALEQCEEILALESNNVASKYLQTLIYQKKKNYLSFSYQNTSFNKPSSAPWHFGSIEYKRKQNSYSYLIRGNYAYMYQLAGAQTELDVYPKIGKKSYLYLNAGLSDGKFVFPLLRFGAEYYRSYKQIEVSLGGRYLFYQLAPVYIVTGQFAWQKKSIQFFYRPYFAMVSNKGTSSHVLGFRKNNEMKEHYFQLEAQYGQVPYNFSLLNDFARLNVIRIGFQQQVRVQKSLFFRFVLMYEYEQITISTIRNRFNSQLVFTKRF